MGTYDQILADLKQAMRDKDRDRLRVLRSLKASILEKEISERKGGQATLGEEQIIQVLMKAAKQRKDSITQFEQGRRKDLADNERAELTVIEGYLPKMMSEAEITVLVEEVIAQTGAESMKDMGKVMGALMPKVKGKADGSLVNNIVRERLEHA